MARESGHRKITAALATFAAGETVGKDTLLWLWGMLDRALEGVLGAMPETVALELIMLASLGAFYWTREQQVIPVLDDSPVFNRNAQPGQEGGDAVG